MARVVAMSYALVVLALAVACTTDATPPTPVAGSASPVASAGVTSPSQPADAVRGAESLAPLVAAERRVEDDLAGESGLSGAVDSDLLAWLAAERAATLRDGLISALFDLGVSPSDLGLARDVSPRGTTQLIVARTQEIGPTTAGAALSLTFLGLMEYGYEHPTSGALDASRTENNPAGGTTTTTTTGSANRNGSSLGAELTIVQETTSVTGTSTSTTRWTADLNACPDASGRVTMHIDGEVVVDASGLPSGRISRSTVTMTTVAQVGDDARIASTTNQPSSGTGIYFSGQLLGTLTLDRAQDKWRSGACVKIESSVGANPEAKPREEVHFTAKPVHKVEGTDLDKPVVATFNGRESARPLDVPQRAPAQLVYQAPAEEGPAGVVALKSTSNRGIGTLDVQFRVAPPATFELQIFSTFQTTRPPYGYSAEALSRALGIIGIRRGPGDTWEGEGMLTADTDLLPEECETTHAIGIRTVQYDWLVRASTIPRVTAAQPMDRDGNGIKLFVDSGPIPEVGNATMTLLCPPSGSIRLPSTTPHWEFTFFQAHATERGGYGVAVDSWEVVATDDTWVEGGVIATRTVYASCAASFLVSCTGNTTYRLILLPP